MKTVLFCTNPYAFGIMQPLYNELLMQNDNVLWYFPNELTGIFPKSLSEANYTNSIAEVWRFGADANFVPGNVFPHYLPGVKIQIFHGLAGEKSGHFRIRHYFDLYLTQGPYFTDKFNQLAKKHKDFVVAETGWCKLDTLYSSELNNPHHLDQNHPKTILYAPTFSPSLSSAVKYRNAILALAHNKQHKIVVKFHDKMDRAVVKMYKQDADTIENMEVSEESNIIPLMQHSDLLISDTSSVVYEFLLLNKPVVTLNSTSSHVRWDDLKKPEQLEKCVADNLNADPHQNDRRWFIDNYHPYTDGKSSLRMIDAAKEYINQYGVPQTRKLSFFRRRKINKLFGPCPTL